MQLSKNATGGNNLQLDGFHRHRLTNLFNILNACEIGFVHRAVKTCHRPPLRKVLISVNHLGNGWLYLLIATLILFSQGLSSWRLVVAAGLAVLLSHLLYPLLKNGLARVRPCDYDLSLPLYGKLLDRYSCPSGHVMTATAVGIPLLIELPELMVAIVSTYLLIAWARIALGHHYPSDLLIGAILGASISLPVSLLVI